MKYEIYYINFQYYASQSFDELEAAIEYGKSKGFEFAIHHGESVVYGWNPIYGGRYF